MFPNDLLPLLSLCEPANDIWSRSPLLPSAFVDDLYWGPVEISSSNVVDPDLEFMRVVWTQGA